VERKEWKLNSSDQINQEEYKIRLSSVRNHEKLVEREGFKPKDQVNQEDRKVQDLKLKLSFRNYKKCVEHKELKLKSSDQVDQEDNEIQLSSVKNHEKLVERKELNNESNDQLNQEDKEIENDVVIDGKQDMETIPTKARAKKKRIKRRRLKNSLPCNINKVYIMKLGTLSKKEYKQQCKSKSMKCKQSTTCHVHEGRRNLKKLKSLIRSITPEHPGWKLGLNWTII